MVPVGVLVEWRMLHDKLSPNPTPSLPALSISLSHSNSPPTSIPIAPTFARWRLDDGGEAERWCLSQAERWCVNGG